MDDLDLDALKKEAFLAENKWEKIGSSLGDSDIAQFCESIKQV